MAHRNVFGLAALCALAACGPGGERDPAVAETTATASATASPDPVETAPAPSASVTASASQAAGPLSPRCEMPLVTGRCKAAFPVFGYDTTEGKCVPFTYGGCDGNDNRFETLEACKAACR